MVVVQGDTRDEAIADVTAAIQFHVETFGPDELIGEEPVLDVFVAEARVAVG